MLTIAVHLVIPSLLITFPTIEIIVGRKKPPNPGGKESLETTPSAGITQIRLGVDSGVTVLSAWISKLPRGIFNLGQDINVTGRCQ